MDSLAGNGIQDLEDSDLDGKIERTKMLIASKGIVSLSDNGHKLNLFLQRLLAERERRNQSPRQKAETDKASTARRSEMVDIALARPTEQTTRMVRAGFVDLGPSMPKEIIELEGLLEDLRGRFENLLTGVPEKGWNKLDDRYAVSCTGAPSEWRPLLRRAAMAGQATRDLSKGIIDLSFKDMVPLTRVRDPPSEEDK